MGARYEVDYKNIEKVVDCTQLNSEIDNLMVFLKMADVFDKDLTPKRRVEYVLTWSWDLLHNGDINSIGGWFDDIDEETYKSIEQQIDSIAKKMEQALLDFKIATDILIYWDYDYDEDRVVFELCWNDIVQFTPKVKTLDNLSVDFELMTS